MSTFSFSSEAPTPPHRKSTWLGTSWLMLTDIVGTSVLTLPGVAAQLGWVPTVGLLVGLCPLAIYTGSLMSRTRRLLASWKGVEPLSMANAAGHVMGDAWASKLVGAGVYGLAFMGGGSYLLTMGQALQGVLYAWDVCLPGCVLAACLVCWPLAACMRSLSDTVLLCFGNFFLILIVLGLVMANLFVEGRPATVETALFAEDLTLMTFLGSATNIAYAYTGHWLYFELMAEMKQPEDFPKVFIFNGPLQVAMYVLVASWGYYYTGKDAKGFFLDNLHPGLAYQWASGLLLAHVAVAFLLKNVVLTRWLHSFLSPARASTFVGQPGGVRAHLEFAACTTFIMAGCFVVANAVPFFDIMLGFIGGLLAAPISFILPIILFARASKHALVSETALGSASPGSPSPGAPSMAPTQAQAMLAEPVQAKLQGDNGSRYAFAGASVSTMDPGTRIGQLVVDRFSKRDMALSAGIGVFALLTMAIGTFDQIHLIAERTQAFGPPFSCRALTLDSTSFSALGYMF